MGERPQTEREAALMDEAASLTRRLLRLEAYALRVRGERETLRRNLKESMGTDICTDTNSDTASEPWPTGVASVLKWARVRHMNARLSAESALERGDLLFRERMRGERRAFEEVIEALERLGECPCD